MVVRLDMVGSPLLIMTPVGTHGGVDGETGPLHVWRATPRASWRASAHGYPQGAGAPHLPGDHTATAEPRHPRRVALAEPRSGARDSPAYLLPVARDARRRLVHHRPRHDWPARSQGAVD